ncbi:chromosome segregation protein SMC [Mycoplasma sp. 1654_15]|uniref:chromosome segregation protein SMC n=1 Tax=Mycoplasma sp. 1654_15 TaxID=2725994 RepID=UPI00144975C0|nr:chromosome segregation protein SMC [Mycoplasma sp. 1654_15]QJB71108.1 chromosome segregation protein SMC [Mycoplasma sp. 1654_15]
MLKLIKIEIEGFKSFADPISINFDGSVVGIVGPNGSGKSNINDAIRWVLGEQSAKQLRGLNMDDVIFAGSKTVKPQDKAMVKLTFKNEDAVEETEQIFTISRVLKRGQGSNEYFYNDQPVRYKDIKNLAVESGISKSSLAIISQGTISEIAEATPEQRKAVIEEAAGTSKYKLDKEEAQKKLIRTTDAIDKLQGAIKELERQVNSLEKQSSKAKIYIEKSKALESVEVGLIVNDLNFFTDKLNTLSTSLAEVEQERNELEINIQTHESTITQNVGFKTEVEQTIQQIGSKIENLKDKLNKINVQEAEIEARRKLIISGEIVVDQKTKIEEIKKQVESLKIQINASKEREVELDRQLTALNAKLNTLRSQETDISKEIGVFIEKKSSASTQINFLKQQFENRNFLSKGIKAIKDNSFLFEGYLGLTSELFKVNQEFAIAIETVLGAALNQIVVKTSEDALEAINFLKKNLSGKATFIPLSSIREREVREDHLLVLKGQKSFLGIGKDLVEFDNQFNKLFGFLLGNIIVVDNVDNANRIAKILDQKYTIVTLEGDLFRPGGTITGGTKQESTSILNYEIKIKELTNNLKFAEDQILDLKTKQSAKNNEIQEANSTIQQVKIEANSISTKLDSLNNELNNLKLTASEIFKEQQEDQESLNLSFDSEKLNLEKEISTLNIELNAKKDRLTNLITEIGKEESKKQELDSRLRKLNTQHSSSITEQDRARFLVEQNQKRLSEHYRLTLEAASQQYSLDLDIEEARHFVDNLKKELKELGSVNLESIQEFEEVNQRYQEKKEHIEELSTAKSKIEEAISDLDKIIINKTTEVVNLVNNEFNMVFQKMFGGGKAEIHFTDKNDVLNSGVEISAQPPGKTIKNLRLFSGGEKAIIAISLLFAILKARPIPLCILDEVEAALDESNVIRYVEFLKLLKENTQFLIITHRSGTMSRVDQLLGVTMQKRGVTSIFSVELSKAKEMLKDELK